MNKVLLHTVIFLILVDASESECFAGTCFIRIPLVVDVHNSNWSSRDVPSNSK